MADLEAAEEALQRMQGLEGTDAGGLVEEEEAPLGVTHPRRRDPGFRA
jgi:hypothetical protein